MDNQIELKRLIVDFNTLIKRLNNAEEYWKNCNDSQYDNSLELYQKILKQTSEAANKIEKKLGRPLTTYESMHGINI